MVVDDQDAVALAHFLSSRIENKLQEFVLPEELRGSLPQDDYNRKLMLAFVLDLDKKVLPGVRPLVAQQLGVASDYNLIFS